MKLLIEILVKQKMYSIIFYWSCKRTIKIKVSIEMLVKQRKKGLLLFSEFPCQYNFINPKLFRQEGKTQGALECILFIK